MSRKRKEGKLFDHQNIVHHSVDDQNDAGGTNAIELSIVMEMMTAIEKEHYT